MSNLSELLPAGAGAKSAEFVASGTLGSGQTVVLNSDGTVGPITISGPSETIPYSSVNTYRSSTTQYQAIAYAPLDNSKFVVGFSSSGCQLVVGSISGTSITYSSITTVTSNSVNQVDVAFQPNSNKFVVMYQDDTGSKLGILKLYTLSGTSVTLNDTVTFDSNGNSAGVTASFSDVNTDLMVLSYAPYSASSYGRVRTATISGTSLSLGTEVVYNSVYTVNPQADFLSDSNTFIIGYKNNSTLYGEVRAGEVSGTSITVGSATVYESSAINNPITRANRETSGSFVVTYRLESNGYTRVVAGTASGTSIDSIGTPVNATNWYQNNNSGLVSVEANKFLLSVDGAFLGSNPQYGLYVYVLTISGTTVSVGAQKTMISPYTGNGVGRMFLAINPNKQFAVSFRNSISPSSLYGSVILGQLQNLVSNSADFIGITDQAIADTATGAVIVQGGVSDKVSGLTTSYDYYVQDNGTLSTTVSSVPAGRALSSTSILLEG